MHRVFLKKLFINASIATFTAWILYLCGRNFKKFLK